MKAVILNHHARSSEACMHGRYDDSIDRNQKGRSAIFSQQALADVGQPSTELASQSAYSMLQTVSRSQYEF
jgi:hypothetical protein